MIAFQESTLDVDDSSIFFVFQLPYWLIRLIVTGINFMHVYAYA